MIVVLGVVILVAAVVVGVAGVLSNGGSSHALTHGFAVFGYHVTGSTGTLFLDGLVVGAVAMFGLSLLLAALGRTSRRGRAARRNLRESRYETAAVRQDRNDLIYQRQSYRAETASVAANGSPGGDHLRSTRRRRRHWFGHRSAQPHTATSTIADPRPGQAAPAEIISSSPPASQTV
jgi:hypothetical protein